MSITPVIFTTLTLIIFSLHWNHFSSCKPIFFNKHGWGIILEHWQLANSYTTKGNHTSPPAALGCQHSLSDEPGLMISPNHYGMLRAPMHYECRSKWVTWGSSQAQGLCHVWKSPFHRDPPHPLALKPFPPRSSVMRLQPWSRGGGVDVQFAAECSAAWLLASATKPLLIQSPNWPVVSSVLFFLVCHCIIYFPTCFLTIFHSYFHSQI